MMMDKKKREQQNEKTNRECLNVSDDMLECVAAAMGKEDEDDFDSTGADYFKNNSNGDLILR